MLNNRPRKIHGWRTPAEVFAEQAHSSSQHGVATTIAPRGVVGFEVNPRCLLATIDRSEGPSIAAGAQQRHRPRREVSALGLLLIVHVGQDRTDESDHGRLVRKDAYETDSALDPFIYPLQRIRRPNLRPVRPRKCAQRQYL